MNHLTEEQLVLYHYGDAGNAAATAAIALHLRDCPVCQAELDAVRCTMDAVDQLAVPERGDGYEASVWARLQPELARPSISWSDRIRALVTPRRLAWSGAAAALFLAAFVAGREVAWRWPAGTPATPVAPAPQAAPQATAAERERVQADVLLMAVDDHLERSQVALSELVNTPVSAKVDISDEQQRARDLVSENRLYRQTALRTGAPAVVSILDDLEPVLVEVANGPSTLDAAEFDRVRRRIDQQDIIFKVRVFGERVREAESRPVVRAGIRG